MASVQAPDPAHDSNGSKPNPAPPSPRNATDDGFFGALRKGITQPIKMPAMTTFAIPMPTATVTPQPEVPKPRPQSTDESRRLQQAIDEKEMAQEEIRRLSAQLAELLAEKQRHESAVARVPVLEAELEKLKSEIVRTRDRVEYKRIEANEIETQKVKETSQSLRNEIGRLTADLQSARSHITSLTSTISDLQIQLSELQRGASEADLKRAEAEQSAQIANAKASNLAIEIATLSQARDEALSKLAMSREAVSLEARRDRERWQAKAAEKERQFFVELDAAVADRNSWRAKADSLQVALDKALKKLSTAAADESVKWSQEKARLEAELQRKTTSLQDAMDALQSRDQTKKAVALLSLEAQRRIPQLSTADVKVIEQNYAFQSVAQSLMESVRDRDALIAQLRFDNAALSRKIGEFDPNSASHNKQVQ